MARDMSGCGCSRGLSEGVVHDDTQQTIGLAAHSLPGVAGSALIRAEPERWHDTGG